MHCCKLLIRLHNFFTLRTCLSIFVGTISILWSIVFYHKLHTLKGFAAFWFRWENISIDVEQCTIDTPSILQDIFRPPVDCSMCAHVKSVDKISKISPEEFENVYAYSGRPVVIKDGQKNWSAKKIFAFDFFKNIYSENSPALLNFERECQFFPYKTEFQFLKQVFNMSVERSRMEEEPWYVGWSNCDSSAADILRTHYQRPYFLPQLSEVSKTDWIFIGTPGHGANIHIDHVGNPSWQAQIKGKKLWTLEPPPECYFECTPMQVTVYPGEIIVLDTNIWYHGTIILGDELSITIGAEYD